VTVSTPARRLAARCERAAQLGLLLYPLGCGFRGGTDLTELGAAQPGSPRNAAFARLSQQIAALSPSGALLLSDVKDVPAPALRSRGGGSELILPGGPSPASVHIQRADGESLARIVGDARGSRVASVDPLPVADAALVFVQAGVMPLSLGQTDLFILDQAGDAAEIYLPELELEPGERVGFWVAADGSTYARQRLRVRERAHQF